MSPPTPRPFLPSAPLSRTQTLFPPLDSLHFLYRIGRDPWRTSALLSFRRPLRPSSPGCTRPLSRDTSSSVLWTLALLHLLDLERGGRHRIESTGLCRWGCWSRGICALVAVGLPPNGSPHVEGRAKASGLLRQAPPLTPAPWAGREKGGCAPSFFKGLDFFHKAVS